MPIVEKKDDGSILIHTGKRVGHRIELGPPVWLEKPILTKEEIAATDGAKAPVKLLAPPASRATSK